MIEEKLEDLIYLADGLENHFNNYPNAFQKFSSDYRWFIYTNPHKKTSITVHVHKDFVYVSAESKHMMFSSIKHTSWWPWSKKTKQLHESRAKLLKICLALNSESNTNIYDLFPELAQEKLEEAIWGKKDE